ncbi:MAG TPA: Gfo/Idh/MocA family oxidoreductase [Bacteroidota bacterium]|nr:Gfo/Idh/MocA family oxidoreductase [Bacteroidota bacterium]
MDKPRIHTLGIIMNGVTGRMGSRQHLERSILAIRNQGGVKTKSGEVIMPDPILVGRNGEKLKAMADKYGLKRYSTDLDQCLADPTNVIYFDAQTTSQRSASVTKAIKAGKSLYCEKPITSTFDEAMVLTRAAVAAGLKNGVVQDKLWLPGLLKLKSLVDSGFFGKILSVRGEFGYWVFDGKDQPCQRPSWNYRKEEGGGIITDMLCHWRYVIDNLFGTVSAVSCLGATHIESRLDEARKEYKCTADDSAYATFLCANGVICNFNSSWSVRVRRDDLLTLQVDGTHGSAVAGLHKCVAQSAASTPTYVWNPDIESPIDYFAGWKEVPPPQEMDNAFKMQWELFLRHVVDNEPFPWTFLEGAKGIQLAELAMKSWGEKKWVDVPELKV